MEKKMTVFYCRLLAAMGFGTFASGCEWMTPRLMYGMPYMDYAVTGKVTGDDGKPVKGIGVRAAENLEKADTTDADGSFSLAGETFPADSLVLEFKDTDGTENGLYKDKTQGVALTKTGDGHGHWYHGTYEAKDISVRMNPAEED